MATTRYPLTRDRILEAALELVDEQGLDALTMRRLGQRLGFEAMSLYNYVANKEDVIDGILDLVLAEGELPAADGEWDAAVRKSAISVHAALQRHPWASTLVMAPSSYSRRPSVPWTMILAMPRSRSAKFNTTNPAVGLTSRRGRRRFPPAATA